MSKEAEIMDVERKEQEGQTFEAGAKMFGLVTNPDRPPHGQTRFSYSDPYLCSHGQDYGLDPNLDPDYYFYPYNPSPYYST